MDSEVLKEIQDRCRRMETRLTKFLEHQGFETKVRRPIFRNGTIDVPSDACSLKDLLSVVPPNWDADEEIIVVHKDQEIMSFYLPKR